MSLECTAKVVFGGLCNLGELGRACRGGACFSRLIVLVKMGCVCRDSGACLSRWGILLEMERVFELGCACRVLVEVA